MLASPAVIGYSAAPAPAVTGTVSLVNAKSKDAGNVAIWLEPVGAAKGAGKGETPVLRQKGKQFVPRVVFCQVGQKVDFPNDDPFPHNVFSSSDVKKFDLGLYQAGETRQLPMTRPGVIPVFCNIHPQMKAFIIVVKSPFYGVSDKNGDIQIKDVTPGNYRLKVWHERAKQEKLDELSRPVTVTASGANLGTIQVDESGFFTVPHKNKDGKDYAPGN